MIRLTLIVAIIFVMTSVAIFADPEIIDKAEQLFEDGKIGESYKILIQGLENSSFPMEKADIYWRLSRTKCFIADIKKQRGGQNDELLRDYEAGVEYANQALRYNSNSYNAYYWRAINWGHWAEVKSSLESLGKLGLAKDDLTLTVRIKPDFDRAYFFLGMLYVSLPGWPISFGNRDYAVSLMRFSIDIAEKEEKALEYLLNLASTLWERNWDINARKNNTRGMRDAFYRKTDPAEKYCFYEGVINFLQTSSYSTQKLSELSDREEARLILDYLEMRLKVVITKQEDRTAFLKSLRELRAKW